MILCAEFLHLRHNAATAQRALREELAGSVLMNKELLEKLEIIRHGKMAESEVRVVSRVLFSSFPHVQGHLPYPGDWRLVYVLFFSFL